ncbi:putative glycoside hydrolase [Anaerolineales bacterium HSG6]|nr:putative glycoside hydrolase [Anaerolineales bacterium HSG6]
MVLLFFISITGCYWAVQAIRYKTITVHFQDIGSQKAVTNVTLTTNIETVNQPNHNQDRFTAQFIVNPLVSTATIRLEVTSPGYRPGGLSLAIPRWQMAPKIDIELEPLEISGQLIDAQTNQPLPHVTLEANSDNYPQTITSDEAGRFLFQRLWSGDRIKILPPPGYQPIPDIMLTEENLAFPFDLALEPTMVSGQILDADGEPAANVRLVAGAGIRRQVVMTDEDGNFVFNYLIPQDQVAVESPEYLPLAQTIGSQQNLSLTVEPNELQVNLWNSYLDQPMAGAEVNIGDVMTATTDGQGRLDLSHVPAPSVITVTQQGYNTITFEYQGDNNFNAEMVPGQVIGIVRDRLTGKPLPRATIYIGSSVSQADESGRFIIDTLVDEPQQILVKAAGYKRGYAQLDKRTILTDTLQPPFRGGDEQWVQTRPCPDTPSDAPPCLELTVEPFQAKALYIPFYHLSNREAILEYLDFIESSDQLNAFVIDVKGDFGLLAWDSHVKLVETTKADSDYSNYSDYWMSLEELITEAKSRQIYSIARFVVFKDDPLAQNKIEYAVVNDEGEVWIDGENLAWSNPFRTEVWQYNIDLAKEVAEFGFDEINFDYIRFPSDGDVTAIVYEEENSLETRTSAIRDFMAGMADALRPYPIFISADVFGLTVWVTPETDMYIGQRVDDLVPSIHYLAPMVYPSTFSSGNLGYDDPSSEPYNVVNRSQKAAMKRVPSHVKVRPWLQAYWYDLSEMELLRQGAEDANADGWSWWNAAGVYDPALFGVESEE